MISADEEILLLSDQVKDWNVQIAVLAAKQEAATATAMQFAQELDILRHKQQRAARQLRELELHKSGMYMWENIGDGG